MKGSDPGANKPVTRRLFFAFWPDESTRALIAHGTRKAVRGSGGRPVPVENLHSTIVFLGAVPEDGLDRLAAVAQTLKSEPVPLRFDRLEHWAKPAVLCLTNSELLPAATDLATSLSRLLLAQGFTPDPKPYRPHITVARKVVKPHELGRTHPVVWSVDEIALVESVTAPEGPRYTVLQRWPLQA